MNWYKKLYYGENARKKRAKIIYQLDRHKISIGTFVIMPALNGQDLLDVIPSFMLFREGYRDNLILGLAVTREEAYEVCARIITDVFNETGTYDVRGYFL